MGFFKSLVDKVKGTKEEIEKRAAKKAAEVALDQTKRAAKGALDSAGAAIEKALFGEEEKEDAPPEPPDPFAKLKAAEREKKERAAKEARIEKDVDAELAALKKKLGK